MNRDEAAYQEARERAEHDSSILALVLTGSRTRGFDHQWSDYDYALFVASDSLATHDARLRSRHAGGHCYLFTLDSFADHATWGSASAWERYTWAHAAVEIDRTNGRVAGLLDEKSRVPLEHVESHICYSLSWYLNQAYHGLKALRAGDREAHRLEVGEAVRPLLDALFAIHGRRLLPYYKYLRWELENFPLRQLSFGASELMEMVLRLQSAGHPDTLRALTTEARRLFSPRGYAHLFEEYRARLVIGFPKEPTVHGVG